MQPMKRFERRGSMNKVQERKTSLAVIFGLPGRKPGVYQKGQKLL